MHTFSQVYWLSLPSRGLMPAVGPYSPFDVCGDVSTYEGGVGALKAFCYLPSSTSGAPWPRFAHSLGFSRKPCSYARSVVQTTPVEARDGSRPACGLHCQRYFSFQCNKKSNVLTILARTSRVEECFTAFPSSGGNVVPCLRRVSNDSRHVSHTSLGNLCPCRSDSDTIFRTRIGSLAASTRFALATSWSIAFATSRQEPAAAANQTLCSICRDCATLPHEILYHLCTLVIVVVRQYMSRIVFACRSRLRRKIFCAWALPMTRRTRRARAPRSSCDTSATSPRRDTGSHGSSLRHLMVAFSSPSSGKT
ncbi:hypothetical protein KC361_g195 [Hortaea werneckii]|nr:hypothetical protein KC361_g195 [Hortaea werneckii]